MKEETKEIIKSLFKKPDYDLFPFGKSDKWLISALITLLLGLILVPIFIDYADDIGIFIIVLLLSFCALQIRQDKLKSSLS